MNPERGMPELEWRDTYFIVFERSARPTLTQVEAAISDASDRVTIENLEADEEGLFESLLVQAPEDNAALEISFEEGEAVIEQSVQLAKNLQDEIDSEILAQLVRADARLDVMHFERVNRGGFDEEEDEEDFYGGALDPTSLLTVVDALVRLTGGVPIDPASGGVLG